jgi:hypothetical protein
MVEWNCNAKTLNLNEQFQHSRPSYEGDRVFGITVKLIATISDAAAVLDVSFSDDWGDYTKRITLYIGEHKVYEDHDYIEWRVHLNSVLGDTANFRICFDDHPRAAGVIVSIDVPAEADEGQAINLCMVIMNVGTAAGIFYLHVVGPDGINRQIGLPNGGLVEAGQTVENICSIFTMLNDSWLGHIKLWREGV